MSCPRTFELEAARDGRLAGRDRESLERHLRGCAICEAQRRAFDALARSLAALPVAPDDMLRVRRQRQRLLAAYDESLRSPRRRLRWTRAAVVVAGVALAGAAFALIPRADRASSAIERIDDAPSPRRSDPEAGPVSRADELSATVPAHEAEIASPRPAPPRRGPRPSSSSSSQIARAFREAVALLERGRSRDAAAALRAFAARYPDDSRAEDAAYLLVIALQRTGDAEAVRAAARDYLRRHPQGFRREDIEALAGAGAPERR